MLLALAWLAAPAVAEPPPPAEDDGQRTTPAAPDAPAGSSFQDQLRDAKQLYFRGDRQGALDQLQGLQIRLYAGESPPWDETVDTLIYLGEIHYALDQQEQARAAFRWLLERAPDTPISPYHHPVEVVTLFELVRTTVKAELAGQQPDPPPIFEPPPAPAWVYAPLGIPQFVQRRPAVGAAFAGLQLGFATASVATYVYLATHELPPGPVRPPAAETQQRLRYGLQWPATIAFYGTWALGSVEAAGAWRKGHRAPELTVLPAMSPTSRGLVVHGTF